jgi:hypothetical protein
MKWTWIPKLILIANTSFAAYYGMTQIRDKRERWFHYLSIAAFVGMLFLVFRRDFWLPFLGETVVPEPLLALREGQGDTTYTVSVEPGSKVIYWAAETGMQIGESPWKAYGAYENSGVVLADAKGQATFRFNTPQSYSIPSGRVLPRHVHYRVIRPGTAWLEPVQTAML